MQSTAKIVKICHLESAYVSKYVCSLPLLLSFSLCLSLSPSYAQTENGSTVQIKCGKIRWITLHTLLTYGQRQTEIFSYLPFQPSMVLTANNPSSRQQGRENPRCWCSRQETASFLPAVAVTTVCSKWFFFTITPSLVYSLLSLVFLLSILFFLPIISLSLSLPPPPFLHIFQV